VLLHQCYSPNVSFPSGIRDRFRVKTTFSDRNVVPGSTKYVAYKKKYKFTCTFYICIQLLNSGFVQGQQRRLLLAHFGALNLSKYDFNIGPGKCLSLLYIIYI